MGYTNTASLQERRDKWCVRATKQIIYKRALDMGCQIATRHSGEVALQIITYQEEVRNPPLQTLA